MLQRGRSFLNPHAYLNERANFCVLVPISKRAKFRRCIDPVAYLEDLR